MNKLDKNYFDGFEKRCNYVMDVIERTFDVQGKFIRKFTLYMHPLDNFNEVKHVKYSTNYEHPKAFSNHITIASINSEGRYKTYSLSDRFPAKWLFDDFEDELKSGKALYDKKQLERKQEYVKSAEEKLNNIKHAIEFGSDELTINMLLELQDIIDRKLK